MSDQTAPAADTASTPENPSIYEAFKFMPAGDALRPMVFGAECNCGQVIASITGLALNIDIPQGMDLIAKCRCGREHSISKQAEAVKKVKEAMAAAAAATNGAAGTVPLADAIAPTV